MVDLHSHTDRSDGTLSPEELVGLAAQKGLSALAITDHDTLEGYEVVAAHADRLDLELVCGIELSASFLDGTIHVLGYFLGDPPGAQFRDHLGCIQKSRQERNHRLAAKLQSLGLDVTAEEAEALGLSQTGRPHFARVLMRKGYVADIRQAFDRYLDESAPAFVARKDASADNVLRWIREAGGISSWAHPARFFRDRKLAVDDTVAELAAKGLNALEAFHSDHEASETHLLKAIAERMDLGVTGGSDFHNPETARVQLGGLRLPNYLLEQLRGRTARMSPPPELS